MPLYKPSELHHFLAGLGVNPKKALSQNFLIDGNILRKIVAAAQVQPGDVVLEVGPGPGSLTEALLEAGAHVIAVEKDGILAQALERFKGTGKHLDIYCQDILEFPITDRLSPFLKTGQKAKVIANLPYHLTTPILVKMVPLSDVFSDLVVMVQDEVARRFTAKPQTSEYSSFTVFLDYYSTPKYAFRVSRHCFYPSPQVDSAIVTLNLHQPPVVPDEKRFFELTRTAFEHRRKMLRSSLKDLYAPEAVMRCLELAGKSPQARPEELSLEDFISLITFLATT